MIDPTFLLQSQSGSLATQKTWCVAKPSADAKALQANINYVCANVSCSVIQPGGPCFIPNNLVSHAAVAMNLYYAYNGRHSWNCYFANSGVIVQSDPSKPRLPFPPRFSTIIAPGKSRSRSCLVALWNCSLFSRMCGGSDNIF